MLDRGYARSCIRTSENAVNPNFGGPYYKVGCSPYPTSRSLWHGRERSRGGPRRERTATPRMPVVCQCRRIQTSPGPYGIRKNRLFMRVIVPLWTRLELRFLTRNEIRSAVRVRSSAL